MIAINAPRGIAMKRLIVVTALVTLATSLLWTPTASADPGVNGSQTIAVTCTDGSAFRVNTGPAPNVGRVAWVVDGTGVFVTSYLAFTNGTETFVAFDSKQGLQGVITCTGDAGGGFTVISKGFWTPR